MPITIRDVAKHAGVAPSTVSRVIANSNRISQRTKEKVFQSMKELGYHPNYNARSLAVKNTKCLGIIMPRSTEEAFQNPFFPEVIRGISVCANEKGYALFLSTGGNEEQHREAVVDMVQGRRVDGVISLYTKVDDPLVEYLSDQDFPFVVVGQPYNDKLKISYVDNDNVQAAKEATEHLIKLGHRHIGFVGGSIDLLVTRNRLIGYRQALEEAGMAYDESLAIHESFLQEGGYKAMVELLRNDNPPTALLVIDDVMALGVISALSEIGISVPQQVSVVSMNDVPIAKVSSPPLTTVNIGIYDLGYQATKKLLKWVEEDEPDFTPTIVEHQLMVRHSTAKRQTESQNV
ncbi:LacI family DNA-binding transcriptional regulator [Caldalkalibacillus salinus]|uniref:LacI family DNA-binding transcriptional regulator n=1 Tax=Caldalkalibacillus salinus TaxID=2803787 RepID=UPI0019230E63|nr:LacI family DNA-binding transcriptional regulator [Caldalkalibacillus salinus]